MNTREAWMSKSSDDKAPKGHSRRDMFKLAGAASALAGSGIAQAQGAVPPAAHREALETLTAAEAEILEAFCARLIPTDANGPGAAEARAAHYIDRALAGFLAPSRPAYAAGLAALDRYATSARGAAFPKLSPADQDAVLEDVEAGKAEGLPPGLSSFFSL